MLQRTRPHQAAAARRQIRAATASAFQPAQQTMQQAPTRSLAAPPPPLSRQCAERAACPACDAAALADRGRRLIVRGSFRGPVTVEAMRECSIPLLRAHVATDAEHRAVTQQRRWLSIAHVSSRCALASYSHGPPREATRLSASRRVRYSSCLSCSRLSTGSGS